MPEVGDVEAQGEAIEERLAALYPDAWEEQSDEGDFDLIQISLDRLEQQVAAGRYRQAEQTRVELYAIFEFGPERRLQAFDPALAAEVEGLIWFGALDRPGLAELVAGKAPRREVKATRAALDDKLADVAATLGDSASQATVITNAAIIVFREGLEAVLILAAITASLIGANRRKRRPVMLGALAGLAVSILTFLLATTLLGSLQQYGERLEAIVGLVAIAVLLLVMNWFFHRVYWTEWISSFHKRRRALLARDEDARVAFFSAQVLGLFLLGLSSVYREGFETTLFLQSLELSAGLGPTVAGALLGLAATALVAVVTFRLQRKLPYKRMLIVTGVLLAFVLVVMVGATVRTMQGAGWLPIHSIDADVPYWLGTWLGVFPTWETLGAQAVAFAFVIGSYYAAEYVRIKRPRRQAALRPQAPRRCAPPRPSSPPSRSGPPRPAEGSRRRVAPERARAVGPAQRLAAERPGRRDQLDLAERDAVARRVGRARGGGAGVRRGRREQLGRGARERQAGGADAARPGRAPRGRAAPRPPSGGPCRGPAPGRAGRRACRRAPRTPPRSRSRPARASRTRAGRPRGPWRPRR